jgi:phosphatidylserine/phosphatidylglycerophosphate/cardiolipin synthase-like enzyme
MKNMRNMLVLSILSFTVISCSIGEPPAGNFWNGRKIQVYFTTPGYNAESAVDAKIQEKIKMLVDSAKDSVDLCIMGLTEPTIFNAVYGAWKRGVTVRFVGDFGYLDSAEYQTLVALGIQFRIGNKDKIMHNKYVIVDKRYVVCGSANFTGTDIFRSYNNVLFIDSPQIAAYYRSDFETMLIKGLFGTDKTDHFFSGFTNNVFSLTNSDNTFTYISVHFAPYYGVNATETTRMDKVFLNLIDTAREKIFFAIYAFTHADIANRMISAAKLNNVLVYGVFDKSWHTGNNASTHQLFIDEIGNTPNIFVKYDGNNNHVIGNTLSGEKCHNKFMVIDPGTTNAAVLTGSMNFSKAASYNGNDENFLIIRDPFIVDLYVKYFMQMYAVGSHPTKDLGGDAMQNMREVTISEINWGGSMDFDGKYVAGDRFIELKNNTQHSINISGWFISGITLIQKGRYYVMYIFPEGTVLPPGGFHVLTYSTNYAYTSLKKANTFEHLFFYHPLDHAYIEMWLKDKNGAVVDKAGYFSGGSLAPLHGDILANGTPSAYVKSMVRIGTNDGTLIGSWTTCGVNFASTINPFYRINTYATPGME